MDQDSFIEFQAGFGAGFIAGLAKLGGNTVGVPLRLHLFRQMWQAFPCLLPEVRRIRMRPVRDSETETEKPGDGGRCRTCLLYTSFGLSDLYFS